MPQIHESQLLSGNNPKTTRRKFVKWTVGTLAGGLTALGLGRMYKAKIEVRNAHSAKISKELASLGFNKDYDIICNSYKWEPSDPKHMQFMELVRSLSAKYKIGPFRVLDTIQANPISAEQLSAINQTRDFWEREMKKLSAKKDPESIEKYKKATSKYNHWTLINEIISDVMGSNTGREMESEISKAGGGRDAIHEQAEMERRRQSSKTSAAVKRFLAARAAGKAKKA
ncbi:MAG: hypothetical protein V1494_04195 [Candidatus Diapherotrites archaeon]